MTPEAMRRDTPDAAFTVLHPSWVPDPSWIQVPVPVAIGTDAGTGVPGRPG
ncbi:hypothetical protein [Streptomyces sp. NPDC014623]|uniref:hypothetical protein n=1 Tax=Streptomyces sp. NPDC014623 TaxID=3364875 RepID=UPI0036FDC21B